MTKPRSILPGTRYLITRSVRQRQMWFVPSPAVNQIIGYCTAMAVARTGVRLIAGVAMSNHLHDIVVDPNARIPEFTHWRHTHIAKCIKHHFGVEENLWSTEGTGYTELLDDNAVLDKLVYTLANPVAAGCVPESQSWPGYITGVSDLAGGTYTFARPDYFSSRMPATATLTIERPDIFLELDDRRLVELAEQNLRRRELEEQRSRKSFQGRAAVMAVVPGSVPSEPRRSSGSCPRFATRNRALLTRAVQNLFDFWRDYDSARRDKKRSAVFPAGTYAVRRFLGLPVHDFT